MNDALIDLVIRLGFTSFLMTLTYTLPWFGKAKCKYWITHIAVWTFFVLMFHAVYMTKMKFIEPVVDPVLHYGGLFIVIAFSLFMHIYTYKWVVTNMKTECGEDMLKYYEVNSADKVSNFKTIKYFCYRNGDIHGIIGVMYIIVTISWMIYSLSGIIGIVMCIIKQYGV